jgi:hypothetical protein
LASWMLQSCSTNKKALTMRWMALVSIGSRMQVLATMLARQREKEKAVHKFGAVALISAKVFTCLIYIYIYIFKT